MLPAVNEMSTFDASQYYKSVGVITHPLHSPLANVLSPGKQPMLWDWSKIDTPLPESVLEKYLKSSPDNNLGFICGRRSDLTIIDIDWYVKGVWEFITAGIDTSKWVYQTHADGKEGHIIFKYSNKIEANTYQDIGFDILSDSEIKDRKTGELYVAARNCVASPSIHPGDHNKYTLTQDITTRPELPSQMAARMSEIITIYKEIKEEILPKCRKPFRELWKYLFVDKPRPTKSNELYHDTSIFMGDMDNRIRHLHLCSELKANGATDKHLTLICMMIFGDRYDPLTTEKNLAYIDPTKTATTESIKKDPILSRFYIEDMNYTVKSDQVKDSEPSDLIELTDEEIQARKDSFKDRRLPLVLPPTHFVSVFCDWLGGLTDGYEEYQKLGALWLISAFCNNTVVVRLKQEAVRPNIFVTMLGRSTTSRKSTIVQRTRQIFENVTDIYLPNDDFSLEGYLESLSINPTQHHVRDEVAGFLAKIHKQYNEGFSELECAIYDGQNFRKTLASKGKKDPQVFEISNPYVTKLYATTPDNYIKFMTIEDFLCGREFRTLFAFPTYSKPKMALDIEREEDIKKWVLVLERAKEIYNFIKNSSQVTFKFEPEALAYYSKITSDLEDEADKKGNDILSSAVGRSQTHILKLAMLIELGKSPISTIITKESIEIASNAVVIYFLPTLIDIVGRLQEDTKNNQIEKIISVIRRLGGAAQHTKALHDSKLKSKEFAECISTLVESETIEIVREIGTKKIYYILKEMKTTLDMKAFESPVTPSSPREHKVSIDPKGTEILEISTKIALSGGVFLYSYGLNNVNEPEHSTLVQFKKIKNLQNLSSNSTWRDKEIYRIQGTKDTSSVQISREGLTPKKHVIVQRVLEGNSTPNESLSEFALMRKDMINHAKVEFNYVVEELTVFVNSFSKKFPGYEKKHGRKALLYNAEKLRVRGWR